jgi:hypothetical protein
MLIRLLLVFTGRAFVPDTRLYRDNQNETEERGQKQKNDEVQIIRHDDHNGVDKHENDKSVQEYYRPTQNIIPSYLFRLIIRAINITCV